MDHGGLARREGRKPLHGVDASEVAFRHVEPRMSESTLQRIERDALATRLDGNSMGEILQFPGRAPARRLLTLRETMEALGGSERWWRYRIAEGCPVHRWGKRLRLDPDEVQAWLEEERYAPQTR